MWLNILSMSKNISLSIKMILITVLVGTLIWLILNNIQTNQFATLFHTQLHERFVKNAEDDRYRFDHTVKSLYRSVRLLSQHEPLKHYVDDLPHQFSVSELLTHRRPPTWLPAISILRDMVPFHFAMLLDHRMNTREIFKSVNAAIPDRLLHPTRHLLELGQQQTYLTQIDGKPYLLASAQIDSSHKNTEPYYLVLATPVNAAFLLHTQGGSNHGNIIAILDGGNERVLISSKPELISTGMSAANIRRSYLVTNTAFFDYGASDMLIRFVSMTPTDEVQALTHTIGLRGIIAAIAFMIPFTIIMYRITHRIELLNKRINVFIHGMKLDINDSNQGDQIDRLEAKFIALSEQIIEETDLLEYQAMHDGLTGLPNRNMFYNHLDMSLNEAIRGKQTLAVMILDLDKFKEINDSLGHYIGDEVLKIVAKRFLHNMRTTDTIARYGGDEFAVVLPNIDQSRVTHIARKLVELVNRPINTNGFNIDVGTSIGIAMYPQDARDKHSLLQHADHAMYDAKRSRSGYKFYDPANTGASHIKLLHEDR